MTDKKQDKKQDKKYFLHNNTRIIITEHFQNKGKTITGIIKEAVAKEAKLTPSQKVLISV